MIEEYLSVQDVLVIGGALMALLITAIKLYQFKILKKF